MTPHKVFGPLYGLLLLGMLAWLMFAHIDLFRTGLSECDAYERTLLKRLETAKVGSPQAQEIKKELQSYLAGATSECAELERVYQEASDKYTAVILALLTGAGIAAGGLVQSRRNSDP